MLILAKNDNDKSFYLFIYTTLIIQRSKIINWELKNNVNFNTLQKSSTRFVEKKKESFGLLDP